jgi:hypothetical protein
MPRCPLCRSALVTIGFGLYPTAICNSCGARWIQDGRQQRAINQVQEPSLMVQEPSLMVQEPSLMVQEPSLMVQGRSQPATQPALPRALTALSGQLLPGGLPW